MFKKLRNGSFEQVDPSISESFVSNLLDTAKSFRGIKLIAFIILFVGCGTYIPYGVSIYIVNHMEEAVGGLDVNNEFIPFLSSIWYINLQAIPIVTAIIAMRFYRDRNRVKGHFIYYLCITIFMMFFGLFLFKVFQLFVSYFILRMIYTLLFIVSFFYCIRQGYKNALFMIHGDQKKRSALTEWASRNSKTVLTVLGIIGSAYFIIKALFEPAANMERRIIGSMVDFLPLILVLANFAFLYYIGVVTRSYYLYKYSERFRMKYGYDIEVWYGPKYNMKSSSSTRKNER